jgi:hypothetical protein
MDGLSDGDFGFCRCECLMGDAYRECVDDSVRLEGFEASMVSTWRECVDESARLECFEESLVSSWLSRLEGDIYPLCSTLIECCACLVAGLLAGDVTFFLEWALAGSCRDWAVSFVLLCLELLRALAWMKSLRVLAGMELLRVLGWIELLRPRPPCDECLVRDTDLSRFDCGPSRLECDESSFLRVGSEDLPLFEAGSPSPDACLRGELERTFSIGRLLDGTETTGVPLIVGLLFDWRLDMLLSLRMECLLEVSNEATEVPLLLLFS